MDEPMSYLKRRATAAAFDYAQATSASQATSHFPTATRSLSEVEGRASTKSAAAAPNRPHFSRADFMTRLPIQKHRCPESRAHAGSPAPLPGERLLTPLSSPPPCRSLIGAALRLGRAH